MSIAASNTRTPLESLRGFTAVFLTLAGLSCGMTLLYLGMRAVMDVGGACASGGPYVPRVECPEGVPLLMMAGIWGGLIFLGLYLWATTKHKAPTLAGFAWPALFLSLGWNFLEFGIDPPFGEGLVWGWLVCAALFALMGGLPLLAMTKPIMSQFGRRGPEVPSARVVIPTKSKIQELRRQQPGARPEPAQREPTARRDDESMVDALERLSAMHRSGALTDVEFEAAKRRVLSGEA